MTRALADLTWPIRTERLSLRPAGEDDVAATWRFRRIPEVGQYIGWHATDIEAYRARFLEPRRLVTTLVVEHAGTVVGDLMLRPEDAWAQAEVSEQAKRVQAELGWTLDPAYGGRGLATEAVRGLLRICFEELGLRRVTASCFADNTASWRLMERVGMRREAHTVAESLHRSGAWLDGFGYAMLADEWPPTAAGTVGGLD